MFSSIKPVFISFTLMLRICLYSTLWVLITDTKVKREEKCEAVFWTPNASLTSSCTNGFNKSKKKAKTLTWKKLHSLKYCTGFSQQGATFDQVILNDCTLECHERRWCAHIFWMHALSLWTYRKKVQIRKSDNIAWGPNFIWQTVYVH